MRLASSLHYGEMCPYSLVPSAAAAGENRRSKIAVGFDRVPDTLDSGRSCGGRDKRGREDVPPRV